MTKLAFCLRLCQSVGMPDTPRTYSTAKAHKLVMDKLGAEMAKRTIESYTNENRYREILHPTQADDGSFQWTMRDIECAAYIFEHIHEPFKWSKKKIIKNWGKEHPGDAIEGETMGAQEHKVDANKPAKTRTDASLIQYGQYFNLTTLKQSYDDTVQAYVEQVGELRKEVKRIANENLRLQAHVDELEFKYGEKGVLNKALYKLGIIRVKEKVAE